MLPDYAKEEILILGLEQRSRLADVRTGKKIQNQILYIFCLLFIIYQSITLTCWYSKQVTTTLLPCKFPQGDTSPRLGTPALRDFSAISNQTYQAWGLKQAKKSIYIKAIQFQFWFKMF